ncbi:hypothetical protein [Actinoplanes sp. NPDC026619]|uniref:hypothetical protein n=1 Tax=Actinoplanes sp. NPDC026619 TaxID=3155798 RepID=UPI0033FA97D9
MSNRTLLVVSGVVALVAAGAWSWFLAGRSLSDMDSWSSVLSAVVALVAGILSIGLAAAGIRSARRETAATPARRDGGVHIGRDLNGAVVTGDHNEVRTRGDHQR